MARLKEVAILFASGVCALSSAQIANAADLLQHDNVYTPSWFGLYGGLNIGFGGHGSNATDRGDGFLLRYLIIPILA